MVIIENMEQGTPEWLDFRRAKRTASETPAVLRVSPYQSWEGLRSIKRGASTFTTKAMQHGHDNEGRARLWAEAETGHFFRPVVLEEGDYAASLDGWSDAAILEIKCPFKGRESDTWKLAEQGVIRADYQMQVQHQLAVSGMSTAYFVVFDAESGRGLMVEQHANQDDWKRITSAWDDFWAWSQTDDPDPIKDARTDDAWRDAALEYQSLNRRLAELEALKEASRKRLIELAGDSKKSLGFGVTVSRLEKQGTVDWKKVQAAHPEINAEAFRGKAKTEYRITL